MNDHDDNDEPVCGGSYDHDLRLVDDPQTTHEAHMTLGWALRDFKTALRESPGGRFVVWLADRLAAVLPKPKDRS